MDLIKEFFLEAFPNPERTDCPDEEVLRFLAEGRLPPGHSALLHIASCSECFREYRSFCFELQDRQDQATAKSTDVGTRTAEGMNWSRLASALETTSGGMPPIEHILEWVTAYRHRYSR
jgi:hypothetical protein